MSGSMMVLVANFHREIPVRHLDGGKIFSLIDYSGYNPTVWGEHSTIRFSWVTACGWSEIILHDAAFITMSVSVKNWGWPGLRGGDIGVK